MIASWIAAAVLAVGFGGQERPRVRFHHFHYQVSDPTAAMNEAAKAFDGRRVILQGLGVGVGAGDHYILFDEFGPGARRPRPSGAAAMTAAARWLDKNSIDIAAAPPAAPGSSLSFAGESPDHVAFSADDVDEIAAHLRAQGTEPARRTDDSLFYAASDGVVVEITLDTERPDAFWCPMHPHVRSSSTGTCPLCSMALVPIPPPKLGDYRMDVTHAPGRDGSGARALRFTITDPETGETVDRFSEIHERLFHLFIVSRDLEYFAHEHPSRSGDVFELSVDLPGGAYVLIADFLPAAGTQQMVQQAIVTAGYRESPFRPAQHLTPDVSDKIVEGIRIRLTADVRAARESSLRFTFSDAATGAPLFDLQPYLGAPGHLLIVNRDLTEAFHTHPGGSATAMGPDVAFTPLLPSAGFYKMWLQVRRAGKVITAPFVVEVR